MTTERKPIFLCCGANGRAVVYGRVDAIPQPGEPVILHNARMILYWPEECRGLFGLAANGPRDGLLITPAVERTQETVWQEWIAVAPSVANALEDLP